MYKKDMALNNLQYQCQYAIKSNQSKKNVPQITLHLIRSRVSFGLLPNEVKVLQLLLN